MRQERYDEAEPLCKQAIDISLGVEHPLTQQFLKNYVTLLADLHTGGDAEAMLRLLAQKEQSEDGDEEGCRNF